MHVTNNGLGNNFFPKQSTQMDLAENIILNDLF